MPADTPHWLELTEFAQCDPSAMAFRALVALLDTWPAGDQAAAIDYADKLLSTWPDDVRLAPWSWCKAASKGAVPPTWPLVRALQLKTHHLTKGNVNLARLAHRASLEHTTVLDVPLYSDCQELSFLYHCPETFPSLETLRAADKFDDGEVRALAASPLWRTLEVFEIEDLTDSLVHRKDASRIVPRLDRPGRVRHLTLRSPDLIAVWEANRLPRLRSAGVFIRSIEEARALAKRPELARLTSLSIAFRCGFSGNSPFEPFLGNVIEADEAAAEVFFRRARLDRLEKLAIFGYPMGYWGREGLGREGLKALITSGLLEHLKLLRLQFLPLGDKGVAALAPALGKRLQTLELVNVYCKGRGAAALVDSPCLPSLRRLDLSANRIDAEHFVGMAGVRMPHLQSLDLSGPPINPYYWDIGQQPLLDVGAAAWANSANAERLRQLRLSNCHLTDEALIAIFQSARLRNLEVLDLSHNSFTAAAIARAVVGSPLWRTLTELGLNQCRLDNTALEALARVQDAPALRSLQLGYNSIGPKGAAALATWPALGRVWHLDLHDNLIGDDGLVALAESPNLGRLLELDVEQDCWNSRAFTFSDRAARALATARALTRLDSLFSGCVDEYHGSAYSPGFTKDGLHALRTAPGMRPAFKACCGDFSGISEYYERAEFNEAAELTDQDIRARPFALNDKEAAPGKHGMQQIRSNAGGAPAFDAEKPPEIRPLLPELDLEDEDIIEGIEFREPIPATDTSTMLRLSLEDPQRPLPEQVAKWISDALGSIFRAAALGYFETGGCGSRFEEDGRRVATHASSSVGLKGDPQRAVQLIRETLWWVSAPADTVLDDLSLCLSQPPATAASRFMQLAALNVERWQFGDEPGHRIDRLPFSAAQREGIRQILAEFHAAEPAQGWVEVATGDGGRVRIYIKYLDDSADFNTLNILVEVLTPEISGFIHRLMYECAFMLLPMAFAATVEVARTIDCDWPKVEVVGSAAALHKVLARGPYHWWRHT
jgi:Ran GTPase-activating protein (RanGAP) involved in mRNA processing and transport